MRENMEGMAVREDCRHYLHRSTPTGEALQRCRLSANDEHPFGCPQGCLFFEERTVSGAGWTQPSKEPMTNTADGLHTLPPEPKRRRGKRRG
jgi:hypothetical protein